MCTEKFFCKLGLSSLIVLPLCCRRLSCLHNCVLHRNTKDDHLLLVRDRYLWSCASSRLEHYTVQSLDVVGENRGYYLDVADILWVESVAVTVAESSESSRNWVGNHIDDSAVYH